MLYVSFGSTLLIGLFFQPLDFSPMKALGNKIKEKSSYRTAHLKHSNNSEKISSNPIRKTKTNLSQGQKIEHDSYRAVS